MGAAVSYPSSSRVLPIAAMAVLVGGAMALASPWGIWCLIVLAVMLAGLADVASG